MSIYPDDDQIHFACSTSCYAANVCATMGNLIIQFSTYVSIAEASFGGFAEKMQKVHKDAWKVLRVSLHLIN